MLGVPPPTGDPGAEVRPEVGATAGKRAGREVGWCWLGKDPKGDFMLYEEFRIQKMQKGTNRGFLYCFCCFEGFFF